jgi:2,4-dienoyl-CoA reductase-like NADH-dependent reductase (Old Yellow Enzyme family)/thioredoxin reductase
MYDERYAPLFEPLRVGTVTLRNRFTTLPIGMHGFNNVDGTPTSEMVEAYRRRAKGGAGMVSIHLTMADDRESSSRGELIFANPKAVPAFALLSRAIHEEGAVAAIQIANCWHTDFPYRMSQVSAAEIQRIIDLYAKVATRIVDAGFDLITIQGANGWPVHRFMSGAYNDRLDRFSDPTLLPSLIIKAIRREVGKALNIAIRMAYDDNSGPIGITPEKVQTLFAPAFEDAGLDLLDLALGRGPIEPGARSYDEQLYAKAEDVLSRFEGIRDQTGIPVLARGRVTSPDDALEALKYVDLVGHARQAVADPDFVKKIFHGRQDEINRCIACHYCGNKLLVRGNPQSCAVNWEFLRDRVPFRSVKGRPGLPKILVVGAGIAGLTAAWRLGDAGFPVEVWDRSDTPGGLLADVKDMPALNMADLYFVVDHTMRQIAKASVPIRYGRSFEGGGERSAAGFDIVILATGADSFVTGTAGTADFIDYRDYMRGSSELGERVAVVSAGEGAEVAISIARSGRKVWLLETTRHFATPVYDYGSRRAPALRDYVAECGIEIVRRAKVSSVGPREVVYSSPRGASKALSVDSIVMSGRQLKSSPAQPVAREMIDGQRTTIYRIGDCFAVRGIGEATEQATAVARDLTNLWA